MIFIRRQLKDARQSENVETKFLNFFFPGIMQNVWKCLVFKHHGSPRWIKSTQVDQKRIEKGDNFVVSYPAESTQWCALKRSYLHWNQLSDEINWWLPPILHHQVGHRRCFSLDVVDSWTARAVAFITGFIGHFIGINNGNSWTTDESYSFRQAGT